MMVTQAPNRDHLIRQSELVPSDILSTPITVIGAGAIGSFVVLSLAKMGFENISVYDFDEVSVENMSSQFYRFTDIGKKKVEALKDIVTDFTGNSITTNDRYEGRKYFDGVVISAVDSMGVRRMIWEAHKQKSFGTKFLIDPRMGAETASLFVTRPMNYEEGERYEQSLYSDDTAVQERCTAKATMFTALMLSGLVAKVVRDVLVKENYKWHYEWSIAADDIMSWNNVPTPSVDGVRPAGDRVQIRRFNPIPEPTVYVDDASTFEPLSAEAGVTLTAESIRNARDLLSRQEADEMILTPEQIQRYRDELMNPPGWSTIGVPRNVPINTATSATTVTFPGEFRYSITYDDNGNANTTIASGGDTVRPHSSSLEDPAEDELVF